MQQSISMNDEELAGVTGGAYLSVSDWRQYLSQNIISPLNTLSYSASDSDKQQIEACITVLRNTCLPGAAVAAPVTSLWFEYQSTIRSTIQDSNVRTQLDSLLGSAYQYIIDHT